MNPYRLWYLVDQTAALPDGIYGAKTLHGSFSSLALAQAQATSDGITHYSVEFNQGLDNDDYQIVYIV